MPKKTFHIEVEEDSPEHIAVLELARQIRRGGAIVTMTDSDDSLIPTEFNPPVTRAEVDEAVGTVIRKIGRHL